MRAGQVHVPSEDGQLNADRVHPREAQGEKKHPPEDQSLGRGKQRARKERTKATGCGPKNGESTSGLLSRAS